MLREIIGLAALICWLAQGAILGSAATITYTYDSLNRLTQVDYSSGVRITYTYDAVGNRLTLTTTIPGAACPPEVIVDNLPAGQSSAQVSFTGGWSASSAPNPYGLNGSLQSRSAGSTYTWRTETLNATQACTYQVFVWWTAAASRSAAVPISVSGQTGGPTTLTFNQQINGGQWNLHGTYTFPAGAQGAVKTTAPATGQAAADAVRFVLAVGDTTPPDTTITSGPSGTITTNSATFDWTGSDNSTPTASLVYAYRLDPVEPTFSPFASATSKTYTGLANGPYTFYVKAKDLAGNEDPTPATQPFTVNVAAACPPEVIVDNLPPGQISAQVSFTGTWKTSRASNSYGANGSLQSSGPGLETYTWQTEVFNAAQDCSYQVFVWWTAAPDRSTAVPITVSGHTGGATTKTFNQQVNGGQWNLHGSYTFPAGAQGTVQVTDQNGLAAADAVRFVLGGGAPAPGPADIAGTWAIYLSETAGQPGWSRGAITIDATGAVTGAWGDADNQLQTLAAGSGATIDGAGTVGGTFHLSDGRTVTVLATLAPDKALIAGVYSATGTSPSRGTLTLVKTGGMFAPANLAGTWAVYLGETAGAPGHARGSLTIDGSGTVTGSWVDEGDRIVTLAAGSAATLDGAGTVGGTYHLSDGRTVTLLGTMAPGRTLIAGVYNARGATPGRGTVTLVKTGGTFAPTDLTGPWAVYLGETAGRPGWSRGSITIDATGAMAGAWVDADNQRRTVAPGSVAAIEGTGAVTGTYYLSEGGTATSTATSEGGKGLIAGSITLTGPRAGQGTLTLVRKPAAAPTPALIVTRTGPGAGTIASDPVGIVCGATCAATFPGGAAVTVQATPHPGSIFVGWSGDCVGVGPCTVTTSRTHHVMATFAPQPEIILDNRDPDVSRTGKWCVAPAADSYGTDSEYSCGPGPHAFRWTPTIPIAGNYQVYIRWPAHPDRSTAVPVTVGHAGGTDTRLFNQQTDGSHWVLHGTYPFAPGATAYVEVTDANGQATADAIRLVPAP